MISHSFSTLPFLSENTKKYQNEKQTKELNTKILYYEKNSTLGPYGYRCQHDTC